SSDLHQPESVPFDKVDDLALAIKLIAERPLVHIGILYRPDDGSTRLCHFAFHFDLRDELPDNSYHWLQVTLDPIIRRLVGAVCQTIVSRKESIPYGFTFEGAYFEPQTAAYIKHPLGYGLTCATFVLGIFRSVEVELVDTSTWPTDRADDLAW